MTVSIIIPCYNVEDYIEECIESAFSQTYEDIEVIAIDNNSTDVTLKKLKELQIKFPKLIVLQEHKKGAPATRNKGLSLAKGEWIQFLDADDLILKDKISTQIRLIRENTSFVVGTHIRRQLNKQDVKKPLVVMNPWSALVKGLLGNTVTNLYNKELINQIGGWDESLKSSQEADLMFRLLKVNSDVEYDDSYNTIIRERPYGQISNNSKENAIRRAAVRLEIYNYVEESIKLDKKAMHIIWTGMYNYSREVANNDLILAKKLFNTLPSTFLPPQSLKAKALKIYIQFFGFKAVPKLYLEK